jgi:hypothetical protein
MDQQSTKRKRFAVISVSIGLGLTVILIWIFFSIRNSDHVLGIQDYVGNVGNKIRLLTEMQANIYKSEQAEKSAVMADTDETSTNFADQSRQAAHLVELERQELELLIQNDSTDKEKASFSEFNSSWRELQRVDQVILEYAVQNTNLKAMDLSFHQGGEAVQRIESAIEHLISQAAPEDKSCQVRMLAYKALLAAFQLYNLHALHIAEQLDEKMDQIEASIQRHSQNIESTFKELSEIPALSEESRVVLKEAIVAYTDLTAVTAKVVALSRKNTNIKSFQLSLGRKRKIAAECEEILKNLLEEVGNRKFKATR